ncbi:inositol monophosphatase family protein [Trichothermofontia sp.]
MPPTPTPRQILATLLPPLRLAAAYARQIQPQITRRPAKAADSVFGAALSDADLSIQTLVEVAILAHFPHLRFYGEEYEQSYNTKYFRAIALGPAHEYLITLDPIDGTQFYLDGHPNYQIILSILNTDDYEAAIALTPAQDIYYYALRGQGCWYGPLAADLDDCQPLRIQNPSPTILLGLEMEKYAPALRATSGETAAGSPTKTLHERYTVIDIATGYSPTQPIPNVNGILSGELAGVILRSGNFIDGAALAFMAQEAGAIVTTHTGLPLPPLADCPAYRRPGLLIAASPTIHQDLLHAIATYRPEAT